MYVHNLFEDVQYYTHLDKNFPRNVKSLLCIYLINTRILHVGIQLYIKYAQ